MRRQIKIFLGAALVKNPGLLKSLRGISLRNALAANLSSHADKTVEAKKEAHTSEDNWQQAKPLMVHMRYEDVPSESERIKTRAFFNALLGGGKSCSRYESIIAKKLAS